MVTAPYKLKSKAGDIPRFCLSKLSENCTCAVSALAAPAVDVKFTQTQAYLV